MPHHRWLRKDTDLDAYPHGTGTLQQRRSAGEALGKVEQALEHYLRFESRDRTYYWVSLLAVDPNGAMRGEVTLSIVTRSKLSYNYYRNEAEPTFSAGAWHVSIFQQQFQAPGVAPFGLQIQKTDRSGTPHHWTFHFKVLDEPATYVDEPNGIWSTTTTQGTDEQTVSRGRDASAFLQNFSQAKENGVLTLVNYHVANMITVYTYSVTFNRRDRYDTTSILRPELYQGVLDPGATAVRRVLWQIIAHQPCTIPGFEGFTEVHVQFHSRELGPWDNYFPGAPAPPMNTWQTWFIMRPEGNVSARGSGGGASRQLLAVSELGHGRSGVRAARRGFEVGARRNRDGGAGVQVWQ